MILLFFSLLLFFSEKSNQDSLKGMDDICRDSINRQFQASDYCYWIVDNCEPVEIVEHNFFFDSGSQLFPMFLKVRTPDGGYYSYPAACNEDYFFPEAWSECLSWWQNHKYNGYDVEVCATNASTDCNI